MEIYNKEDTRKPEISGYIITHPSGYGSDTIPPECHDRGGLFLLHINCSL